MANSKSTNRGLGKLEGQMQALLEHLLPEIRQQLSNLEESSKKADTSLSEIKGQLLGLSVSVNNHLKHHQEMEEKKGDKIFKIATIFLQVLLTATVGYLLMRR